MARIEDFEEELNTQEVCSDFKETKPFEDVKTLASQRPGWEDIIPEPLTDDQKRDIEFSEYLYGERMRKWYVKPSILIASMVALFGPMFLISTTWIALLVGTGLAFSITLGVPFAIYMWYRRGQDF